MTEVDFVIPTFNHADYLAETLQSVAALAARHAADVIVRTTVVDDGSTDGTRRILDEVGAATRVIRHAVNRGKLAALNTAAAHLDGDFVVVLDSDDRVRLEFLSVLLDAIDVTGADFAYSGCFLIDAEGERVGRGRSLDFRDGLIETHSFIPDCALTRRACFMSVLPLDESVRTLPKHFRWKQVCGLGNRGHYVDQPLFDYRMHDANMSDIGSLIQRDLAEGRTDHALLSGYWAVRQEAIQ